MQIVDAQQHELGPLLDWNDNDLETRHKVISEVLLAWMDAVGVDFALVNPTNDPWGLDAVTKHTDRFGMVLGVREPDAPDVEERVAHLKDQPGALAFRVSFGKSTRDPKGEAGLAKFRSGALDNLFAACEKHKVAVFCSAYGLVNLVGEIAERHPDLALIVDHMGIAQPPLHPRDNPPWKTLTDVLALAKYPNVYVKVSGALVLSDEGYPYKDSWPYVHQMLDTFGAPRLMWASDIGRFVGRLGWDNSHYPQAKEDYLGKHTYAESLFMFSKTDEISAADKELLLGGTVRKLLGWPAK